MFFQTEPTQFDLIFEFYAKLLLIKFIQVVFTYLPSFFISGAFFTRISNCRMGPFENSYLPNIVVSRQLDAENWSRQPGRATIGRATIGRMRQLDAGDNWTVDACDMH
jgi:hypothetical protein